jgi:hypothetical protein
MAANATGQRMVSGRISLVNAVNSFLGFLVLLLLVVEAVLGAVLLKAQGQIQLVALYAFVAIIVLLVAVICFFNYYRPDSLAGPAGQGLRDFCRRVSGDWWETMVPDHPTAISRVTILADPATATIRMKGTAYARDGSHAANWETEAACINLNTKKIFYYWKGVHPSRPTEPYEGFGEISLDDAEPPNRFETGSGAFYDANLTDLKTATRKTVVLWRSTEPETAEMRQGDRKAIAALIRGKFEET